MSELAGGSGLFPRRFGFGLGFGLWTAFCSLLDFGFGWAASDLFCRQTLPAPSAQLGLWWPIVGSKVEQRLCDLPLQKLRGSSIENEEDLRKGPASMQLPTDCPSMLACSSITASSAV